MQIGPIGQGSHPVALDMDLDSGLSIRPDLDKAVGVGKADQRAGGNVVNPPSSGDVLDVQMSGEHQLHPISLQQPPQLRGILQHVATPPGMERLPAQMLDHVVMHHQQHQLFFGCRQFLLQPGQLFRG
ncbi:hypothetical protein NW838_02745 [Synechococcus sp. R55.2]